MRAVRKGDFLAVVATNEWAAIWASTTIVATWSAWAGLPDEAKLFDYVRNSKIDRNEVLQTTGDATKEEKAGGRTVEATYDLTLNTHGSIGPSCAVADFKDGALTVWTPSQASFLLRSQLATMLDLPPERVRCIYVEGAGCYGRNGSDDCSSEAALIAKQLGRPVRLQWMRSDEHGWDPKGPPFCLTTAPTLTTRAALPPGDPTYFLVNDRCSVLVRRCLQPFSRSCRSWDRGLAPTIRVWAFRTP